MRGGEGGDATLSYTDTLIMTVIVTDRDLDRPKVIASDLNAPFMSLVSIHASMQRCIDTM